LAVTALISWVARHDAVVFLDVQLVDAMQRVARPGKCSDIAFLHALHLGNGRDKIALFAERRIASSMRRHFGDRFQAFFARPQRILVGADAHRIRIHRAARSAHAALCVLCHGVLVEKGKGGAGGQQRSHAADIAAGKSTVKN
jgi:hypothetical protein